MISLQDIKDFCYLNYLDSGIPVSEGYFIAGISRTISLHISAKALP